MPIVRSRKTKSKKVVRKKKPLAKKFELPTEYEEPSMDYDDMNILIHGEKKIGKTWLTNQGGRVLFLQFDPPRKQYRRMEMHCPDWQTLAKSIVQLKTMAKKAKFPYDRICVDGADVMYRKCQDFICEREGVEDPGEVPHGKGWSMLRRTFTRVIEDLLNLPCGVWFLAHSKWVEVKSRTGSKVEKLIPTMTPTCEEILNSKVDGWFAYDYWGIQRILVVLGDEQTGAGHALDGQFLTPEGEPVREVFIGNEKTKAYQKFIDAFNNKQEFVDLNDWKMRKEQKPRVKKKVVRKKIRSRK